MNRSILLLTALPAAGLVTLAVISSPVSTPEQVARPSVDAVFSAPDVEASSGNISVSVDLDRDSVLQGTDGLVRAEVILRSDHPVEETRRVPTDLVVVLDTSGSMEGQKIEEARQSAIELLAGLSDHDRFSLVRYSGLAAVEIPLSAATAAHREIWSQQIGKLEAHGSTNMQHGLEVGADVHAPQPDRARRTILISDGLPDSAHGLIEQARSSTRSETSLTTVGIGDDYDERLMSQLADAGSGNFYWVRQGQDLTTVFDHELSTAAETVASGMTIQYSGLDGAELVSAAGYSIIDDAFSVGSMYAGQERRLWLTFRVPAGTVVADLQLGGLTASWVSPIVSEGPRLAGLSLPPVDVVADEEEYLSSIDVDAWGRSVTTEEYSQMRSAVSQRMQAGDKDGALALIDAYDNTNRALNNDINCQEVWDNLDETAVLREEVESNFAGADQASRRNIFSKALNMSSYSERRKGQAKGY